MEDRYKRTELGLGTEPGAGSGLGSFLRGLADRPSARPMGPRRRGRLAGGR